MGRWDALKPNDNSSPKQSHHSTSSRLNWNKPRKQDSTIGYQSPQHSIASDFANQLCFYRSRSNKFDPSKVTKMLNDVRSASIEVQASVSLVHLVRLLEIDHETIQKKSWYLINKKICDSKQDFKKYELEECISVISEHAKSNKGASYQSVGCLARLVSSHAKDLPAEVTVRNIVGPIMLPELQHANGIEANQVSICDAIERFLSNSRFASAMLVSLVQDVSPDGKEETITNGIRINLFRSLQNLLFSEFTSNRLKSKACSTLASVIETLRKTNESRNDTTVHYLDQAKLEAFLCQNLDNQHPLYRPSLLLIRALLRMYRMTSLCSMLLFPGPPTQCQFAYSKDVPCRYCFCQMSAFSPFLSSIHKAIAMKSSGLAFDCAIEFVTALPLNHWLMQQTGKSAPVLVSGFYRKVVDSLINILAITRCAVLQQRRDWDDSLGRLCTTVLLIIPWNDERLLKAGEALWSTLAKTFQDNQNVAIASIMIMSMGGRVNPQGRLPPMALPACRFLSCQEHSIPFVRMLLSHIQIGDTSSSSLDLFYAMLRTRPESALILWTDFELVLRGAESGDKKRGGICLCVLEAFLLGRHNFPSDGMKGLEETGIVSELTFYVLEATKEYNSSKICCRRLNCYALLTQRDWDYLELDLDRLSEQVHGLLGLCKDELKDVRKEACRAMGEICSNYMTFQRLSTPLGASISLEIGGRLCCIMTDVLKQDENASVRAMAIFALGNFAFAINETDAFELVSSGSVVEIADLIHAALDDSNDKVVGNAIRSLGHWGSILARLHRTSTEDYFAQCLLGVIQGLSLQLARTLALVSKEQPAITSWKERSAAKKHGWGACFSLGRVLASITHLEQSDLDRTLFQAVEQLVHCVQHTSFLSEKVVLAAMGSLRALKPIKLVIVTRKSGLVGEALVYCSLLLFVEGCNPRYREEGNLLLSHLLSCASFSDVAIVLKHPEISRSMLESLYQWMVEQEMEGRTFEIFALGLQRPVLSEYYDVSLEQRFASRALLQYKKEHSIELHSDDDGGDEI